MGKGRRLRREREAIRAEERRESQKKKTFFEKMDRPLYRPFAVNLAQIPLLTVLGGGGFFGVAAFSALMAMVWLDGVGSGGYDDVITLRQGVFDIREKPIRFFFNLCAVIFADLFCTLFPVLFYFQETLPS